MVAFTIEVDDSKLQRAFDLLSGDDGGHLENELAHELGAAAVRALQGPTSLWPVDTGASRDAFRFEVHPVTNEVKITNGEYYATFRVNAAVETLELHLDGISDELDQIVQQTLDRLR